MAATFHWADYLVFAVALMISACIGIYYRCTGNKQSTTKEFLMGGKKLSCVPVALSLHASFMSAIFILGTPAEVYVHGTMYCWMILAYFLSFPFVAHIFLPIFHRLDITSAYEYLERRFNQWARLAGSLTFSLMMLLYMGVVLYTPALAFSQVTGLSTYISIIGIGLVCTFYTAMGGLKAVVWTDTFQMVTIFVGMIALLVGGTLAVGGVTEVINRVEAGQRIQLVDWNPDPRVRHTVWTQPIGGALMTLALYAANQAMIQRYLSIEKTTHAQAAVYISMCSTTISLIFVSLLGLVMFAYYYDCDPLTSGQVAKSDQLIPLFVLDVLGAYHGLPGLFTACVFSAALSTVSSGVNSLAAVVLSDVVQPVFTWIYKVEMKDRSATMISKILAVIFGLFTVGMGFTASYMGTQVLQVGLSIFGVVGGPLLGMICLAIFFPCANAVGAIVGLVCSLAFLLWLQLGAILYGSAPVGLPLRTDGCVQDNVENSTALTYTPYTATQAFSITSTVPLQESRSLADDFYAISYMWYSILGPGITIIIGLIVSGLTGCSRGRHIESSLMYSCACCCCPGRCREACLCGAEIYSSDDIDSHVDKVLGLKGQANSFCRVDSQDMILEAMEKTDGIKNESYTIHGSETHF